MTLNIDRREERANTWTHLIGLLCCLLTLPFLGYYAYAYGDSALFWGVLAFALGLLMVYTSSTIYHAVNTLRLKNILQIVDHISIYFLIAGTYTPLVIKFLPGQQALVFLSVMWGLALFGTVFKLFFTKRFEFLSVSLYLLMGWLVVFIIKPFLANVPSSVLTWVVIGGLAYTLGVYFYVRGHKPYYHAVWHCFVLAGSLAHVVSVFQSLSL